MNRTTWFCQSELSGCVSNCVAEADRDPGRLDTDINVPVYEFPLGDFSSWNGDPCQGCSEQQCCSANLTCVSRSKNTDACYVAAGCFYNCYELYE